MTITTIFRLMIIILMIAITTIMIIIIIAMLIGWNAPGYITRVVAPDATTNPRFILAPWQVGLTEDHSVKGKSKMCYIFDTAHRFLLKPYSSRKDPIHVLFSPLAVTGQEVADWSMVIDVGMCKFSAVRMILECLVTLRQRRR